MKKEEQSIKEIKDELRGQPFIGKKDSEGHSRVCENCFYGVKEADNPSGIEYAGKCKTSEPKELFKADPLPAVLDGKSVGNYCPIFNDYSHFEEI